MIRDTNRFANLGAFGQPLRNEPKPTEMVTRPPRNIWSRLSEAKDLLGGMGITWRYLVNPSRVVTREYPENRARLKMVERFRGRVVMPHDETGEHNCTACTQCEKACPNGSISVLTTRNLAGKRVLGRYVYRFDQCTQCGLCVESCGFGAIRMGGEFEEAVRDKASLTQILNRKEGR